METKLKLRALLFLLRTAGDYWGNKAAANARLERESDNAEDRQPYTIARRLAEIQLDEALTLSANINDILTDIRASERR